MFEVFYKKQAEKYLEKMPPKLARKIYLSMREIAQGYEQGKDIKLMSGLKNTYRLRISDYRVIYERYEDILLIKIIEIGPRGDVYK